MLLHATKNENGAHSWERLCHIVTKTAQLF